MRPPPGATGPDTAGPDRIERAVAVRDQTGPDQTRQPAPFPDAVKNETVGSDAAPPVTDPKADEAGTAAAKARTRRTVPHEWPPVGTMLKADYFGVVYRAEVIAATKRLKAGKQLRLLDGPAKGRRLDSFSKAMLVATVKQRREQKLGRRGASSGWEFWRVESPSS